MEKRANLLVCVVLGVLACGSDREPQSGPPLVAAFAALPSGAEIDAYARGAAAQVRWVRRAVQAKDSIRWAAVDSVGAAAVGMPVERFRAISAAVEVALKERRVITDRQERLDSLRVELMVLRVRVEERHTN